MPRWITGEAAGCCVRFLSYCLPLGVEPNLPSHRDLSTYTPSNGDITMYLLAGSHT